MSGLGLWYNTEEDTGFRDPHLYCYLPPHRLRVGRPSQDWVEHSWERAQDGHFRQQRSERARPLWVGRLAPYDHEVAEIMERLKQSKPGDNP